MSYFFFVTGWQWWSARQASNGQGGGRGAKAQASLRHCGSGTGHIAAGWDIWCSQWAGQSQVHCAHQGRGKSQKDKQELERGEGEVGSVLWQEWHCVHAFQYHTHTHTQTHTRSPPWKCSNRLTSRPPGTTKSLYGFMTGLLRTKNMPELLWV